jgi:hypothetical protein
LWLALIKILQQLRINKICFQTEPQALPFYKKCGAKLKSETMSSVIAGQKIPILRLPIGWSY